MLFPVFPSKFKPTDMNVEIPKPTIAPTINGAPPIPIAAAVAAPATPRDTAPIPTSTPASPMILDVDSSFPSCRSG